MTTDPGDRRLTPLRLAACCTLALGAWFTGLLIGTLAFEPTASVMVLTPDGRAVIASARASDVDLLEGSGSLFTVAGRNAGFVRRLYGAGAWLVLPTTAGGCRLIQPGRAPQIS